MELGGYADETFGDLLRQILGTDEDEAGEEVEEAGRRSLISASR
ncbi:MAG: hypothetical protein R3E96_05630 [Planctomycetota bacterium]